MIYLIKITELLAGLFAGAGISDAHAGLCTYGFSGSNIHFSESFLGIPNDYGWAPPAPA